MVGLARLGAQPVRPVRHHDPRNAEPLDWRGVPEGRPDHQRRLLLQGQLGNERGQVGRHVRHGGTPRRVERWLPCLAPQPTIAFTGVRRSTSFRTKPQTRSHTARNRSISPHKATDAQPYSPQPVHLSAQSHRRAAIQPATGPSLRTKPQTRSHTARNRSISPHKAPDAQPYSPQPVHLSAQSYRRAAIQPATGPSLRTKLQTRSHTARNRSISPHKATDAQPY